MTLNELRKEIDRIDASMRTLFEERMHVVLKVKAFKKDNKMDILDEQREKEVINKNISALKDQRFEDAYKRFLISVMDISKDLQK